MDHRPVRTSVLTLPWRSTALRTVLWLLAAAGAAAFLWYFSRLVAFLLVGVLLSYLLRPLVDRVQSVGVNRVIAILASFVIVIFGLSILLRYLVPFLVEQVGELSRIVSLDTLGAVASSVEAQLSEFVGIQEGAIRQAVVDAFDALSAMDRMTDMVTFVVGLFANLVYAAVIVPFITFFLLKDGPIIRRRLIGLVPNRYFEVGLSLIHQIEENIGVYFRGLAVQCSSIAVLSSLLLYFAGLDNAVAIGVFTGLANTIPYFGPVVGFVAGAVAGIAQTGDFSLVFGVAVAMLVTQAADNVIFQPFIFSRVAEAHPLVILIVVLIGAQVGGIAGMLLAIPVLTAVRVAARQIVWGLSTYSILRADPVRPVDGA